MVKPYEITIELLCTIPGIDRQSAITIISEIGTDMSQFSNSKRLCCWAGFTPVNDESAGEEFNPCDLYKIYMPLVNAG